MGRQLLALCLVAGTFVIVLSGCNETGPNDPVVKPSDEKQSLDQRMTPEEQKRRMQPPGANKR